MIKKLLGFASRDLLIELSQTVLIAKYLNSAEKIELEPFIAISNQDGTTSIVAIGTDAKTAESPGVDVSNPFVHPRMFVADFIKAEKILQYLISRSGKSQWFTPAPRVVMHQLEKNEGGLTDIEKKVLMELGYGSGAREVLIYEGPSINPEACNFNDLRVQISTQ